MKRSLIIMAFAGLLTVSCGTVGTTSTASRFQDGIYYQAQEPADLFDVKPATIPLPEPAKLFDSYPCACCGEVTGANWIRLVGGQKLCLDCAGSYDRFDV